MSPTVPKENERPVQTLPSPAEAETLIRRHLRPLGIESRPLAALAGAVLAQSVRAERDQPPFDRVTMDGIAISSESWRAGQRRFRIAGTQAAGQPPRALPPGECLEVMTGAVLPPGSDCVIPVERLAVADGWAEADPASAMPFPSCYYTAGMLADLFGRVADGPLQCLEVECRSNGAARCRWLLASPEVIAHVYQRLTEGVSYQDSLAELA
jgi:hypothetical protein